MDGSGEVDNAMDPGKKWYQVVVMNTSAINKEITKGVWMMVILGLVMLALGLGAALLLGNAIVKPLEVIQQSMRDISEGEGDLTSRLEVNGEDEIAQLSKHFNHFVGNIQSIVQQAVSYTHLDVYKRQGPPSGPLLALTTSEC